jgi:hypothetical protein
MAISDTIKLTDGTTEIDLFFDTAGFELLVQGTKFGVAPHDSLYHTSEWEDGEDLVRTRLENRKWPLRLAVRGSTDDDVIDTLASFNRLARQASQYWKEKNVDKVYLEIKLEGATNTTYYDVMEIEPDGVDFFNFFNRTSQEIIFGDGLSITVTTKPWGYGDEETLANELKTPHFEEDADSNGLADNWTESGTPTTTLDTSTFLIGSQSQKVVTDASTTEGVYSDTVSVSTAGNFVSYAWVYRASGDDITLDIQGDSSGSIGTAKYNAATKTEDDDDSNTWKRLDVSGATTSGDSTLSMYVRRLSGDASAATTYYLDKTYLQLGTTTTPDSWMSYRNVRNHYDTGDGDINYFDVDVLGDLQSPIEMDITATTASTGASLMYIVNTRGAHITYLEAERDFNGRADSWTEQSDTSASNGKYLRAGAGLATDTVLTSTTAGALLTNIIEAPVIIRFRTRSANISTQYVDTNSGVGWAQHESSSGQSIIPQENNTWELVESELFYPNVFSGIEDYVTRLYTEFENHSDIANLDVDYVSIVPIRDNSRTIIDMTPPNFNGNPPFSTGDSLHTTYNGEALLYTRSYYNSELSNLIGTIPNCDPEYNKNRFTISYGTKSGANYLTDYSGDDIDDEIQLTIRTTPRTEFLIGTK